MPPSRNPRPLVITILGWLFILVGFAQFILHATRMHRPITPGGLGVLLVELALVACGIFLLRGNNWARWFAVAWIGFHVGVGFLDSFRRGMIHTIMFLIFTWLLFRPEVSAWIHPERDAAA